MYVLRQLLSVLILPVTVTVVIPLWIGRRTGVEFRPPGDIAGLLSVGAGAFSLCVGLLLFGASLGRFVSEGKGTLAPWDPPRRLVATGPYRYVRNPMISGVIFLLVGEALVLRSSPHAAWALAAAAVNAVYIPLLEEPQLERRFGDDYRRYCRHVPRLLPRLRPWDGA
jgi:protein-S-isoprenylcysteine O-methyltransferase Ste14